MPKQSQNCSAKQSQMPLTRGENILPINLMPKQSPIYSMYAILHRNGLNNKCSVYSQFNTYVIFCCTISMRMNEIVWFLNWYVLCNIVKILLFKYKIMLMFILKIYKSCSFALLKGGVFNIILILKWS